MYLSTVCNRYALNVYTPDIIKATVVHVLLGGKGKLMIGAWLKICTLINDGTCRHVRIYP